MTDEDSVKFEVDTHWMECQICNHRCLASSRVKCPLCDALMEKVAEGPDIKTSLPPREA
jgi:hypothetical protein